MNLKNTLKKQPAIVDRRFIVIHMGKLKDKKIKIILSQYLQFKNPTIALSQDALAYIVKKAKVFNPKTSKLDAAQSLLNRAMKEMETIEFRTFESKIDRLEEERTLVEQELLNAEVGQDINFTKKLEAVEARITQLKRELEVKQKQVDRLRKMEAFYLTLKEESFSMTDTQVKLQEGSSLERRWLLQQSKIKAVGQFIQSERTKLSLPQAIDISLIDKILKEGK